MSKFQAIIDLANKNSNTADEFETQSLIAGVPDEIAAALNELKTEERKTTIKDAAKEIFSVLKATEEYKAGLVVKVREARKQEAAGLTKLKLIERAKRYALSSNNYVPLVVLIGKDFDISSDFDNSLLSVPFNFEKEVKATQDNTVTSVAE
jgi:hypothetical protein